MQSCRIKQVFIFGFQLLFFLAFVPAVMAQNHPRTGYVYPAGGRQGTTFQVVVGGQFLNGVANAYVSGEGATAAVLEYTRPLTQRQITELRDKLPELQKMKNDPNAIKEIAEIRKKLADSKIKQANPAIAETATLEITIAPDAEPGERELRLETPLGLSNPLVFCVGQLTEFTEEETTADTTEAGMSITLPAIVNGQILPGDVDRFQFQASKGDRLVFAVSAQKLIPYLPDAVPGWFQAILTLYDAEGNELAYDDDYRFHPDPVLFYEIPKDGQYSVEIRDSIYRGREDFVYRIALGELPFITSIFPLGGRCGAQTTVELKGWNLPIEKLTLDDKDKEPGVYYVSVSDKGLISNSVPFAVDALPECQERETTTPDLIGGQVGGLQKNAQPVTLPIIVNGRIDRSGDWDVFCFKGLAGEKIIGEVYARRLDSPLDSVLKLTPAFAGAGPAPAQAGAAGRQLAANDDHEDKGAGLTTHQADSLLNATLPANGTYYLQIGDAQNKGGQEYSYRLRISAPQPDFELRAVPSSISARGGDIAILTVYAIRKDGFSDEITLTLRDAPAGVVLSGGWVPPQQDSVRLTLTAPPMPQDEPVTLHIEGRAIIQGRQVVRSVVPAEDMMQAFAYRHLVPAKEMRVAVIGRGRLASPMRIIGDSPVRIPAGATALVQIAAPPRLFAGQVQVELSEPPNGIDIQSVSPIRQGLEIVLRSDAAIVKPGLKGNLIANAFTVKAPASGNEKAQAGQRRVQIGTLPAIAFEIIEP